MASTYLGSSINESPTIVLPAGEKLENARGIALAVKDGAVVKPAVGAHVIGISRAVQSKAGDFIVGMALSSASSAGTWVKAQIIKAGYKPTSSGSASGTTEEGGKS